MNKKLLASDEKILKERLFGITGYNKSSIRRDSTIGNFVDPLLIDHGNTSCAELFIRIAKPKQNDFILDVGARENKFIDILQDQKYKNSYGIDTDSKITKSRYGVQMNVMDMPENNQFNIVCFSGLLDYFEGGWFDNGYATSLESLANKLDNLLVASGNIVFGSLESGRDEFLDIFNKKGYTITKTSALILLQKP